MPRAAGRRVDLAEFLRREAPTILRRWEELVRKSARAAHEQPHAALVDHLPQLLERIAANSARGSPASSPSERVSARHATERLEQGFSLAEVVMEYIELRACIFE